MVVNNTEKFASLRSEYPEFIYEGFDYSLEKDSIDMNFHFAISGLAEFHPHWSIARINSGNTEKEVLDALVFSLGMVELISYWKLTCSPKVIIKCSGLSARQKEWWKKLYKKGLGEFFYTNGINPEKDYMSIECAEGAPEVSRAVNAAKKAGATNAVLVPIGGGKDSAVTLELLSGQAERYCYIINPRKATTDTASAAKMGSDKTVIAKRTLDKNMLELNSKGFLNGHTPFSALVAFSSVIAAYINGLSFVALSNESSANESTVKGSEVNHQYSKSFEFESDFIAYEKENINSSVHYFSLLRPLTELKIAELFSRFKSYHGVFRSCNVGSKTDIWCAHCAKCLFVYIILSPFLKGDELLRIFGKDLLSDISLKAIFDELIGNTPEKPFECVGSRGEVNAALQEKIRQLKKEGAALPALLQYYENSCNAEKEDIKEYCSYFDKGNAIPEIFLKEFKERCFGEGAFRD